MSSEVLAAVIGGVIGAAAALVTSGIGTYFALRGVKATIQADREGLLTGIAEDRQNLSRQLSHDSALSREAIKQQRIERAYIKLIAYANLVAYYSAINLRVFQREMDAVQKIRKRDGFFDPASAVGKAAFAEAAPTEDELRLLQSGPTIGEDAEMFALVECLASEDVRKEFDDFHKIITTINDGMIKSRLIFRRERPLAGSATNADETEGPQARVSGSDDDGHQVNSDEPEEIQGTSKPWAQIKAELEDAGDLLVPSMVNLQATLKIKPAQENLIKLIRTELEPNNPNIQLPATSIGFGPTAPPGADGSALVEA
jgi:hypothetical protein